VIISALTRDQGHADCPLHLNWLAVKGNRARTIPAGGQARSDWCIVTVIRVA